MKKLVLIKGAHRFAITYEVGQEAAVLDHLIEMVNRRDSSFDWFDAALLSNQLGQQVAKSLKGMTA